MGAHRSWSKTRKDPLVVSQHIKWRFPPVGGRTIHRFPTLGFRCSSTRSLRIENGRREHWLWVVVSMLLMLLMLLLLLLLLLLICLPLSISLSWPLLSFSPLFNKSPSLDPDPDVDATPTADIDNEGGLEIRTATRLPSVPVLVLVSSICNCDWNWNTSSLNTIHIHRRNNAAIPNTRDRYSCENRWFNADADVDANPRRRRSRFDKILVATTMLPCKVPYQGTVPYRIVRLVDRTD